MLTELIIFACILIWFLYIKCKKPSYMPPGTYGYPIIGDLLARRKKSFTQFVNEKCAKYGNIFTTKLGAFPAVFVADPVLVKKVLSMPQMQERPNFKHLEIQRPHKEFGILWPGGEVWKSNRRFLLTHLKNLGMGKSYMEESVIQEAEYLVKYMEDTYLDRPSVIDKSINLAALNVVWQMIASVRYDMENERMKRFVYQQYETATILNTGLTLTSIVPVVHKLVPKSLLDKWTRVETLKKNHQEFRELCMDLIDKHKKNVKNGEPKDIIDFYLLEKQDEKDVEYYDLVQILVDLFIAGSDTSANSLRWLILHMAMFQEIQEKIHAEIDENVPNDRLPSVSDRERLPYLEATILDSMRLSSLVPVGLTHTAAQTCKVEGYTIPKGTLVFGCLEKCHRNPQYWERPGELYPGHFLDAQGKLDTRNVAFMPFAQGKRQCLGEALARVEVYLFAAAILKKFKIQRVPGENYTLDADNSFPFFNQARPFRICLSKRF